ncbi:MAG: 4Fe-4S binding protein [Clostridia bacterium]|nr:4Fe-4S binding protein [Clostridia bacterium]
MSITKEQIISVKGRGFLRNRGTDCFSGRLVSVAGRFPAETLRTAAECAERFGNGTVIVTSRLSAEIQGIPFEKIPEAEAFMAEHGLAFGGTGAKIRPITACKGSTCVYGNIDTQGLAQTIHQIFYEGMHDVKLPHKFKIGIGGCPNSCMKPSLNDVGIEGCKANAYDPTLCRGCSVCSVAASCPSKAVCVADGKAVLNTDRCTQCGVCVGKCPFGAFAKEVPALCRVFVGGTWGKTRRMGTPLSNLYSEEEIPAVIEKVLLWYKENGYAKERLGAAIDRLGIETLEEAIADDSLLLRKETILAAPVLEA